ncbi:MAG: hypothetical protein NW241_19005 [Bacteroidia bacterium]|nr:hypothetical protein [Bacteroidia bacterium]
MDQNQKDIMRLLGKLSIFLLPFIPLNFYLYYSSPFFQKQQLYHERIEGFFAKPGVKTLLIGDSHPEVVANKFLNDETYNLSFGGDALKESYLKLKYVLDRPNTVQYLFLTADAHMLGAKRVHSANNSFMNLYVVKTGLYDVYKRPAPSVIGDMVPLFNDSYIEYLNTRIKDAATGNLGKRQLYEELRQDHQKWSRDIPEADRIKYAIATGRGDYRNVLENEEQVTYYKQILDLCKEKGIKVIGVQYPAMQEYIAQCPPETRAKYDAFLQAQGFYALLDYRDLTQDPKLYKNEDHVNDEGAKLLLQRMEQDLGMQLANSSAYSSNSHTSLTSN